MPCPIGLFLKANGSLSGAGDGIVLRMMERQIDHEVELGVVIGKTGANIRREDALNHIAGYAVALDITPHGKGGAQPPQVLRDLHGPWPMARDRRRDSDPANLELQLEVNGQRRQQGNTKQMIRDVAAMIEYASSFYTLYPGDVFLSGTPAGVGPMKPGDEIVATIENVGTMRVCVKAFTN
jgi:2-keto-4-pentenoate hydratase/2-oxohepta-3-ene-1,7-dioic acid hydratase in catechol pathway